MAFTDWVVETGVTMREGGLRAGVRDGGEELYHGLLRKLASAGYRAGTNVYDREWDLLILLDACRTDLIAEVADDYGFLGEPGTHASTASCSRGWLRTTFDDDHADEMARTAYVTGNPFTQSHIEAADFAVLDEVWQYAFDDERGTIPAHPITDRAITAGRTHQPERLIVHYMQPHFPSIPDQLCDGMQVESWGGDWRTPFDMLRDGEVTYEGVWNSYRRNLEYVLDEVELLLRNVDADQVAISADHGNAFGEFGIYEHPELIPLRCLREVPWYTTSATDAGEYEPDETHRDSDGFGVEDKLKSLGYL